MFITDAYRVTDREILFAHMQEHSFAELISCVDNHPIVTLAPLILAREEGDKGTLYGHIPKANPHSALIDASGRNPVEVYFLGPHAFIPGNWYLKENPTPTVHFTVVKVRGSFYLVDDKQGKIDILERTVALQEERLKPFEVSGYKPWTVGRLPEEYLDRLLGMIVGFKIPIQEIEGYFKLDQNQTIEDQESVIDNLGFLHAQGMPSDALKIADLMEKSIERMLEKT